MPLISSLRFKVAFFYALFGAGLSVLLSVAVYLVVEQIGHQRMDDIMQVELDSHIHATGFESLNTISIRSYVRRNAEHGSDIPPEISGLVPGKHNVTIDKTDYRVLIADRDGARYFMLFDTQEQHLREAQFLNYVALFALCMTISSSIGGFWLASRVTASVTRLAKQVTQAEPGDMDMPLLKLTGNDEVGELARAFDRYLRRLRNFIDREHYFTADVSHELRTPLAIMLGSVEVLEQDQTLSAKQKERIDRIRRAAQDMIDLTAALLLMSREQEHSMDEAPCNVAEVVHACVEKHQQLIGERPIKMEVELLAEPNLHVERPLLEIVVGNLIRNALFNTQSGSIHLCVDSKKLSVRDTGVGMEREELAHAMERHYKGARSAGAGVGLSLVKRICDRYGWCITLDSCKGEGTAVEVIFSSIECQKLTRN